MKLVRLLPAFCLIVALAAAIGCGGPQPPEEPPKAEETTPPPMEEPKAEEPAEEPAEPSPESKAEPREVKENPLVVLDTSKGKITLELYEDKAPVTVANFLQYVDDKFYDGTIFHRVMPGFMIQGGGHLPDMTEKPTRAPIKNESGNGLKNERGTVAMARKPDPHSASAQFFINHGDKNSFLNKEEARDGWGYCVFAKVVEGMDVVDAIASVPTASQGPFQNVPAEPVVINSVRKVS